MSIDGKYLITEMEVWGEDVLHMDGPAFIEINGRDGRLHFVCVDGFLDIEQTKDGILFSWEGHDDRQPISGAGIAQIIGGHMTGRLLLHRGDHSNFTAVRDNAEQSALLPTGRHELSSDLKK